MATRGKASGDENALVQDFTVKGNDFSSAGAVSIAVKNLLKELGIPQALLRRVAIVAFEAEMNLVMYGGGGGMRLFMPHGLLQLEIADHGPGIEDLELAMTEGWSTATQAMREMGFGAGMGLPNIDRNADRLTIETAPGQGTRLLAEFDLTPA